MSSLSSLLADTRLIITDFDETITLQDSLHLVFDAAYNLKPNFQYDISHYTSVYGDAKENFKLNNAEICSSRLQNVENEIRYQQLIKKVEMSSVQESFDTKIFHGIPKQNFLQSSDKIQLKPGFWKFLSRFHHKIPIVIISVNWSYQMLENLFKTKGYLIDNKDLFLITNDFKYDLQDICIGETVSQGADIEGGVRTGYDKLLITKDYISKFESQDSTVFIGDSETDVLSMLECGKSISMRRALHSSFEMLQKFGKLLNTKKGKEWHYVVDDWNELV